MKQFAVIGNPIAHSKSPEIHAAFAAQFDIKLHYEKLLAEKTQFATSAKHFFQQGLGANVTIPFKEAALLFADELSESAKLAGAVNTLTRHANQIKGDNTDGIGLVRDIRDNHAVTFTNKKVLLLGAGGAARGVILPIAKENPTSISIVNRTAEKAVTLAKKFESYANMHALPFEKLSATYDIIINATSASLSGQSLKLNPIIFGPETLAYDMMYAAQPTPFMRLAHNSGATTKDGLGMLVEQAAESFKIWHGLTPSTKSVTKVLRQQLSNNNT